MPLFVGVNDGMLFVVPLVGKPVTPLGELPLHAYVVFDTKDVKLAAPVDTPEQTVCSAGNITAGIGFTVMEYVAAGPLQPALFTATLYVTVNGALVVLVSVCTGIVLLPDAITPPTPFA